MEPEIKQYDVRIKLCNRCDKMYHHSPEYVPNRENQGPAAGQVGTLKTREPHSQ